MQVQSVDTPSESYQDMAKRLEQKEERAQQNRNVSMKVEKRERCLLLRRQDETKEGGLTGIAFERASVVLCTVESEAPTAHGADEVHVDPPVAICSHDNGTRR